MAFYALCALENFESQYDDNKLTCSKNQLITNSIPALLFLQPYKVKQQI
jgi:hypothetical protein